MACWRVTGREQFGFDFCQENKALSWSLLIPITSGFYTGPDMSFQNCRIGRVRGTSSGLVRVHVRYYTTVNETPELMKTPLPADRENSGRNFTAWYKSLRSWVNALESIRPLLTHNICRPLPSGNASLQPQRHPIDWVPSSSQLTSVLSSR